MRAARYWRVQAQNYRLEIEVPRQNTPDVEETNSAVVSVVEQNEKQLVAAQQAGAA